MLEQWFRTVAIKLRLDSVTLLISFILQNYTTFNQNKWENDKKKAESYECPTKLSRVE